MRFAIAGLGNACVRGHLPALTRLAAERRLTLVAGADRDAARLRAVRAQFRGVPLFESADAMLDSVPSDVLVVACEPSAHAGVAAAGARHGQHLVCEKPLAVTREHRDQIRSAYSGPQLALVPVHQYRYSPTWCAMSRWARVASRLRVPFELAIGVERDGVDSRAATQWRSSVDRSGGMLADHGVHFLALGWTISKDLEVLAAARTWDEHAREHAHATLRVGVGKLKVDVSAAGDERRTRIRLRTAKLAFAWSNDHAAISARGRLVRRWRTDALSDRRHVDALYVPFYRNVVQNLHDCAWRSRRTAEALTVASALITLLERLEGSGDEP